MSTERTGPQCGKTCAECPSDNCTPEAIQNETIAFKDEDNELTNCELEIENPVILNEESSCMNNPKYIGSYKDGLLNIVYQVHEVVGDVYVLEGISYFDLIYLIESGYEPSQEPVLEQVREMKLSDIENPRLFYSWLGIASEFIRAENERDRRERQEDGRNEGNND